MSARTRPEDDLATLRERVAQLEEQLAAARRALVRSPDQEHRGDHSPGGPADVGVDPDADLLAEMREAAHLVEHLAGAGSWVWDIESNTLTWSPELYRLLGVPPDTPPSFELLNRVVHEQDREEAARPRSVSDGDPTGWREYRIVRVNDQAVRHVRAAARPIAAAHQVKGYVGTLIDMTHSRELEHRYRQAQKMEAVGRLTGGVAHDFNNLLTLILGYASLLQNEDPGPELEQIIQAADTAAMVTRQLLSFSRRTGLERRILDPARVVRDTVRLIERLIGEDVELILDIDDAVDPVLADLGQMQQLLLNLAINSRDAMPGGGQLRIIIGNVELGPRDLTGDDDPPPGRYVRMAVQDTGTGMDIPTLQFAVEPFFTTKDQQGTGLGLSTVYNIVKQSGGKFRLESAIGQGTTVEILLPAHGGAAIRPTATALEARPGRGELVLVVEDEPAVGELIQDVLTLGGYEPILAGSATEAADLWERHRQRIALVISDVVLPERRGDELVARFRDTRPDLEVLFVSGYAAETLGPAILEDNFLRKPFAPTELLSRVRATLG